MKRKFLVLIMAIGILTSCLSGCVKIVKVGEESSLYETDTFDAVADVEAIWDSNVLPELLAKAVDLNEVLNEANGNLASVGEKYGIQDQGSSSAWNFTVKGKGQVIEVNTESRAGYIEVKLEGYEGSAALRLQVGPVFKGTAVRDCSEIIKFENYTNQVDYASVSKSIHETITETIINNIDLTSLEGKEIEFVGCFTLDSDSELVITPIELIIN